MPSWFTSKILNWGYVELTLLWLELEFALLQTPTLLLVLVGADSSPSRWWGYHQYSRQPLGFPTIPCPSASETGLAHKKCQIRATYTCSSRALDVHWWYQCYSMWLFIRLYWYQSLGKINFAENFPQAKVAKRSSGLGSWYCSTARAWFTVAL